MAINDQQLKTEKRPPVVVVMGHIDHGKSTLLDYIRKSNVVAGETGGITQKISAYEVTHKTKEGAEETITFLDTPGHEAFQAMRHRGATVADIAILVVSAEDGVKPQTIEAKNTIVASNTPYIVAINKIDKPGADIERTKASLAEHEIYVEGYGGTIPYVSISAKVGTGIEDLLETVSLVAELAELKQNSTAPAEGIIIEAHRDERRGISATFIVRDGTLHKGEVVVSGLALAPVRILESTLGKSISEIGAGRPAVIVGWSELPDVGSTFTTYKSKKEGEVAVEENQEKSKKAGAEENSSKEVSIPVFLKADVAGSLDAMRHELGKLVTEKVDFKIIGSGLGSISEGDIKLMGAKEGSIIIGFSTKIEAGAKEMAERQNIVLATFDIIYKMSEWLREVVKERTPKVEVEEVHGNLKVLKVFSETKTKQILGGKVLKGIVSMGDNVRIMRRDTVIGQGKIVGLQQQKSKAKEVTEGNECGLEIQTKLPAAPGDVLESVVIKIV